MKGGGFGEKDRTVRGKYKNMFAGDWRFASSWLKLEVHVGWFNDNGYIGCVDICSGRIWQVV